MTQDGIGIEQSLRGMFVHAVAGIDDRNIQVRSHQVRCAGTGMANHNDVGAHGSEGIGRVQQRLALLDARSAGENQRSHGAHRLGGNLKRTARPRGCFVEKKEHAFAPK